MLLIFLASRKAISSCEMSQDGQNPSKHGHSSSDFIHNIRYGYVDMSYPPENPYFAQNLTSVGILMAQLASV